MGEFEIGLPPLARPIFRFVYEVSCRVRAESTLELALIHPNILGPPFGHSREPIQRPLLGERCSILQRKSEIRSANG